MGETWRNRIIDTRMVPAEQLHAHPDNWRTHPDSQASALRGLLAEVGIVAPLIAYESERYGGLTLIDGHLRRDAGGTWPVTVLDVSDEEADLILATFDPITGLAEMDTQALADLLGRVEMMPVEDEGVQALLEQLAEESGKRANPQSTADAEPQVGRAEELRQEWGVKIGQLWQLGDHRLICGDCTDPDVVARLMMGEKAEMVWTDPPYGVAVGDKNKFLNSIARSNRIEENLANDDVDEPRLMAMLQGAFDNALSMSLAGGAWYVAAPARPLHVLFGQALKERGIWRQTIQWVKNNATFSPMGVDYHWQAEPIFYGWKPGAGHRYYGGRQQTTVWEIDRPTKSPMHPTMKPVELVGRAVANSSREGEIVYDPFSGSGTTIIACEQLGRKCRAAEISPAYVAVALQRWADATGGEPVLMEAV